VKRHGGCCLKIDGHGGGRWRLWLLLFLMLVWSFENQRARVLLRREICMVWSLFLTPRSLLFYCLQTPNFSLQNRVEFSLFFSNSTCLAATQSSEPSLSLSNSLLISIMQQKSNKIRPKICQEYLQKI